MANRDENDVLRGLIGVVSAFVTAAEHGREPHPLELLGGAMGGIAGSRMPDAFEPAVHPNRRQFAYSATFAVSTGATVAPPGFRTQQNLAEWEERIAEPHPLGAALLRGFGGMAAGAARGHLSHLTADAGNAHLALPPSMLHPRNAHLPATLSSRRTFRQVSPA